MKVSVKWLKEYVNIAIPPVELADKLTMAGNEVKEVKTIGGTWDRIMVGQITDIAPHPNADRLRLATINFGGGNETVVCGAPNIEVGQKIAFAQTGARLRDGHSGQDIQLKSARIRGVESRGMVCSEMELGISDKHEGILVLPPESPVGMSLSDLIGDSIIDFEITPNRPDCLSVIGIARESAAILGESVHLPEVHYSEKEVPIEKQIAVEIVDADLCSRYSASLISGIKIAPSPQWMQEKLLASGMRPINNIVDITNYVMLEYGQPLHAFDYDLIKGRKIIVRRAGEGEVIISLDGVERKLNSSMLVIADTERAVAIAGVMGGANTEVTGETTTILLEAANFKASSIRRTGGELQITSEARYRFERGIAAGLSLPALRRATQLIMELAGGKASSGLIDVYPGKRPDEPVSLSIEKANNILGVVLDQEKIVNTLASLGFECKVKSSGEVLAVPPYWRSDIRLPVDLIEEVARIIGYDRIPDTLLAEPLSRQKPDPLPGLREEVRSSLVAYGFNEIINFSLTSRDWLQKLRPEMDNLGPGLVRVANPMTADMEYLRTSLRHTLLLAYEGNRRHEDGSIRLFEMGKIYFPRKSNLPEEVEVVCGVMGGMRFEQSWQDQDNDKNVDFYDAKGVVEVTFQRLGMSPDFEKGDDVSLHPNKQAAIIISGQKVGVFGEVHPRVLINFEISEAVYLLEINLRQILPFMDSKRMYHPVPRFPSVVRDIALVVDYDIPNTRVIDVIRGFSLVERVDIFDVYSGGQVPPGKKSMAYRIAYRSSLHTLTEEEVNKVQEQILSKLAQDFGAVLRS